MNSFTIYNNNLQSPVQNSSQNINTLITPQIITVTEQTTNIDYSLTRFNMLNITTKNDVLINIDNIPFGTTFYINQLARQQWDQLKLNANKSANFLVLSGQSYCMCTVVQDDKIVGINYANI
jgi:hypothetical protein